MPENDTRVRFAPSPTGYLHIGGARTALYNYLFAQHNNGKLILRIEDTDTERLMEDSIEQILASMRWLGLTWDEGPEAGGEYAPYFQSQRQELYRAEAERLVKEGLAYYCFCTGQQLEQDREEQRAAGQELRYNRRCRDLDPGESIKKVQSGEKAVIRLKTPVEGEIVIHDLIRGEVSFSFSQLDDIIILKTNGLPAYNFACVVDDNAMKMTHIIRAEEHLSNTPRQAFLYTALGYPMPEFAHLSMILAPDRSKLSKRHGATSVEEYRQMGILGEALLNYLTLLGWSPEGEKEIFTLEEAVQEFNLRRVSKTAAVYDVQKLKWMNQQYMMALPLEKVAKEAAPFFVQAGLFEQVPADQAQAHFFKIVDMLRPRVHTLVEMADAAGYFYHPVKEYEEKGVNKSFVKPNAVEILGICRKAIAGAEPFDHDTLEAAFRSAAEQAGVKAGELIHPTRLAISGQTSGPGLFELIATLGQENCLQRIDAAIVYIKENF